MILLKEIDQNYRFMVSEITKQVDAVEKQLKHQSEKRLKKVESREDYIDILKNIIENKCFSRLITCNKENKNAVNITRAVHTITVNLERIGDFCVNIMRQFQFFDDPSYMSKRFDTKPFTKEIKKALDVTNDALFNADLSLALRICRSEFKTDTLYKEHFKQIITDIKDYKRHKDIQNLITALFIFRYMERIGDSLLNIGEAIISSILGEKLKIHQYEALEKGLNHAEVSLPSGKLGFSSIGETRSGCRIGLVQQTDISSKGKSVIFKDGKLEKIKKEKEGIEKWEQLIPGLPPKLYDYREQGNSGSILLECLPGSTFQETLINESPDTILNTIGMICHSCESVWNATLKPNPVKSGFIDQLASRLEDVYHVHPELQNDSHFIGDAAYPALDDILKSAAKLEQTLGAPFSVFIHGDFNVDNIILSQHENKIHYIDLHRSADKDYLQDVSVFLVSIFRLPAISESKRSFINEVLMAFFEFYRQFAEKNGDTRSEIRLALGLARSFITSTRFQLNTKIALDMHQRGMYLLNKAIAHDPDSPETFRLSPFAITF